MKHIHTYLQNIRLPKEGSHKGQNGKLLIIGGSELFHAASKWSLDIASKFVDMVFYASVPSNNALVQEAKGNFWNGMVIRREDLESYISEADCILIGPGMERKETHIEDYSPVNQSVAPTQSLSPEEWNHDTEKVVNYLLQKYSSKKWVIDAGALQMVNPHFLNAQCIVTPHKKEFLRLYHRAVEKLDQKFLDELTAEKLESETVQQGLQNLSRVLHGAVILRKGERDIVVQASEQDSNVLSLVVDGGNKGMSKGGTGDVLAGLVAALATTHDLLTAAVVGSYVNKKAGDSLYQKVGPYFNASDLVNEIPSVFWAELNKEMI